MPMEEQAEHCNSKHVNERPWKASCSSLQEPLIINKANPYCINNFLNSEKAAQAERPCDSHNIKTSNIISKLSMNRSSSLPEPEKRDPNSIPAVPSSLLKNCVAKVPLSQSFPGTNVVIIRSASMPCQRQHDSNSEDNKIDEEVPEEKVECRICLGSLSEGGSWLKMQCSCKGDLSIVHEKCAIKWFKIKGNSKCEVCCNDVANIPVTLIQRSRGGQSQHNTVQEVNSEVDMNSFFSDLIALTLMSSMCYFFFILQLLATRMKYNAIMIAAPFSLTLGVLGSVVSVNTACGNHTWAYSAFQFTSIAVFLQIFLFVLELHVALAMLFASFAGLGLTVGLNSMCLRIIAWRVATIQVRRNVNLS